MKPRALDRSSRSPFARSTPDFAIRAIADGEAEVLLYDEIGFWGVLAKDFVPQLKAVDASTIHLRINSPGGDVFDGLTMYNALKEHPAKVITHVDGIAASIASIIALAGDEVRMAKNAFYMIHEPWTFTIGNAEQLRKDAEVLEKISGQLVGTYVRQSEGDEDEVKEWMRAETWFTADEAKDAGFADVVVDDAPAAENRFDLSVFSHVPRELAARASAPTKRDLERALRDAGLSRSDAKAILAGGFQAVEQRDAAEMHAGLRELITTLTR